MRTVDAEDQVDSVDVEVWELEEEEVGVEELHAEEAQDSADQGPRGGKRERCKLSHLLRSTLHT